MANVLHLPVDILSAGYDELGRWHEPQPEKHPLGACRGLMYALALSLPAWVALVWLVCR